MPISSAADRLGLLPPLRMRWPSQSGEVFLLAGLCLYVLVVGVMPLGRLLIEALRPGEDGQAFGILFDVWQSRAAPRALGNTMIASVGATMVSLLIGGLGAAVLHLTDIRGRTALGFLLLLPMLIPPQISALAWIELTGPSSPLLRLAGLAPPPGTTNPLYSMGGIIWVMGLEHAPLVMLATLTSLRALPRDLVEAASVSGARRTAILWRIVLPLARPGLLAGGALAFVAAIGNFGVPALLGIPGRVTVLTTLIYQRLTGFGPSALAQVASLSLVLVLLAAAGLLLRWLLLRRTSYLDRTGQPLDPFALGRFRLPMECVVWLLVLLISVLPLLALIASALVPALGVRLSVATLSLDNFGFLFSNAALRRAFTNSFLLAGAAALISALASFILGYLTTVRRNALARLLDLLADAPYAVPGTVLALGVIMVFLPPLPVFGVSLYGTAWIILVAYLARFLPLALRPVAASYATMDPALDEAGQILGARVPRRLVQLSLPSVLPATIAGALLVFMSAFNELTLSALLWSTGTETLGVMVFFLQYEGNSPAASALATVVVAVTLAVALLLEVTARRFAPSASLL
ncbi:MAG: iron ABC transporter permease [Alphaproteobacteria bacterium]|uniref:ABC transporter permease n=1 Tax=Devosia riboflavina TaxID=46914 RepID=UPI001269D34E|nr:iron ABC transporter permease [Devosia riboflavina]MBU1334319.1 iron ABC transporter permease [Alphaproteobacteria bacterium]MBU1559663.1 iron ABC transporter permease [Alphaproteobacteria bacterium]MBU2305042.1 iron ABC transporter permease [Alphaproteobacteria bacterium]MBU2367847.1 iron ABC transporter permease [Alphaproteobacteria bacterium]